MKIKLAVCALTAALTAAVALFFAGSAQSQGHQGPREDGGDMPMPDRQMQQRPPMMGGMGGGEAAMVASGSSLYVLSGRTIYKVDAASMQVVKQLDLPHPAAKRLKQEP